MKKPAPERRTVDYIVSGLSDAQVRVLAYLWNSGPMATYSTYTSEAGPHWRRTAHSLVRLGLARYVVYPTHCLWRLNARRADVIRACIEQGRMVYENASLTTVGPCVKDRG